MDAPWVEDGMTDNAVNDPNDSLSGWEAGCPNTNEPNCSLDGDIITSPLTFFFDNLHHTAFDVDRDSRVELPTVNDPYAATTNAKGDQYPDEYSREQVLKHTISHELGHAIGMNHVAGETNLMYQWSVNWRRDGSFSDAEKVQIKVHNSP